MPDGSKFVYENIQQNAEPTGDSIAETASRKGLSISSASTPIIPDSGKKSNPSGKKTSDLRYSRPDADDAVALVRAQPRHCSVIEPRSCRARPRLNPLRATEKATARVALILNSTPCGSNLHRRACASTDSALLGYRTALLQSAAEAEPTPRHRKSHRKGGFFCGGEGEIRTLEPLLTVTRFPVVRPRPTRRLLQIFIPATAGL